MPEKIKLFIVYLSSDLEEDSMKAVQTRTLNLSGTNYEIGYTLGKMVGGIPPLKAQMTSGTEGFGKAQAEEAIILFDKYCPGIVEELNVFADALETSPEKILYYSMTYLMPRCGQIAILPSVSAEGKLLVARNFEFNDSMEDFCLTKTSVTGKYTHMGTSVCIFGRDDGINEHGLSVTMSACGFPVGPLPEMRAPKLKGLQYWAIIRALLENCKDVNEALAYLEGMPIAYNINMILADKAGNAALVETIDGNIATKRIGINTSEQLIYATNHAVLPEMFEYEPKVMTNSVKRYEYIERSLAGKSEITRDMLKEMLLSMYPNGMCCHYYDEFFGTTKSMILCPEDGTVELCWGGRSENGWHVYDINKQLDNTEDTIKIKQDKATPEEFRFQKR